MSEIIVHVGLDVHKESIDVAVAPEGSTEVRHYGTVGGDISSLDRVIRKLRSDYPTLRIGYEAGPCGFEIYRYCRKKNMECLVIAPSRIPKQRGERVKTDRRDATMIARLLRAGELKGIYVPTEEDEALRDMTRARETAMCRCPLNRLSSKNVFIKLKNPTSAWNASPLRLSNRCKPGVGNQWSWRCKRCAEFNWWWPQELSPSWVI